MNRSTRILTITCVNNVQDTLFGKFFYSDSLFILKNYKNNVHNLSFEWTYQYPHFYSYVKTPLQTERIMFNWTKQIVSYQKDTKIY
jgi:hypothetical protein